MKFDPDIFSRTRILVVGDIMLDQYHWGEVSRISPEGPVPIVHVREKSYVLGGAGNVAANLSGLGCQTTITGIYRNDPAGNRIRTILSEKNITNRLMENDSRSTITKTRIMAQGQQLIRLDEENPDPISPALSEKLFHTVETTLAEYHAVILSDYGKGIFQSPGLCQKLITLCRENNLPVLVDPKGTDWERYCHATAITPNTSELRLVAGTDFHNEETSLVDAGRSIRERLNIDWLIVTRGPKGMLLTGPDEQEITIPSVAREVYDVSGAGDTVISSITAAVAAGLSFPEAASLANTAAGIVVGKIGTQPITIAELDSALQLENSKRQTPGGINTHTLEGAKILIKAWRNAGKKIVFTNGCFDLLHPGHINLLHQAKAFGDRLIIGLNTDASVKRLKGDSRPILSEQDRAAILNALDCVDLVVLFDEDTPLSLISNLRPDILVKGADYKPDQVVGRDVVESYGGQVRLVQLLEGYSTTEIAKKVLSAGKNIKKQ
jgi:D-beta-D-heptose 7-phosphate kinase / D-beta-D-heptose 1-phosphate adenosyltransferase